MCDDLINEIKLTDNISVSKENGKFFVYIITHDKTKIIIAEFFNSYYLVIFLKALMEGK